MRGCFHRVVVLAVGYACWPAYGFAAPTATQAAFLRHAQLLRDRERAPARYSVELSDRGGGTTTRSRYVVSVGGGNILLRGDNWVLGKNTKYCFAATRGAGAEHADPGGGWKLTAYEADVGKFDTLLASLGTRVGGLYPLTLYTRKEPADEYFGVDSFALDGGSGSSERRAFAFRRTVTGPAGTGSVTGKLIVDETRDWVVLESQRQSTLVPGSRFTTRRELDGNRCVRYLMEVVEGETGTARESIEYRFSAHADEPLPDRDHTLSYYGFPDPVGTPPDPPGRRTLWLVGAGTGAAALAIVFAYFRRRNGGTR